ncbi:MAG: MMPL family transporter [Pseudomonadota bacterium]
MEQAQPLAPLPLRLIAARPWLVLALFALASLLAAGVLGNGGGGAPRLQIDASLDALVVPGVPALQTQQEIERRFGVRERVLVVLRADDVYQPETLQRIHALSRALFELPGVTGVHALTTVPLAVGDGRTLRLDRIGAATDLDPTRLAELRAAALDNPLVHGQLVSADGRAAAIAVELAPGSDADRAALGLPATILQTADAAAGAGLTVHVTGGVVLRAATSAAVLRQIRWVLPAIAVLVVGFLALAFGTVRGVVLPLLTIAIALLWTLAAFALLGRPMNLVTSLVPPLVVTMSLAYCAHVLSEFEALLRAQPALGRSERIRLLLRTMVAPVTLTALTTAIGVAALAIGELPAVRHFALLSALGVLIAALLALGFVPAALAYATVRPEAQPRGGHALLDRLALRIGRFDIRRRRLILGVALLVLLAALASASRVRIGDQLIGVFEPDARARVDYEAAAAAFGGVTPLTILVDGHMPGVLAEPQQLRALERLQRWLQAQPEIGGATSMVDHLRLLNRTLGGRSDDGLPGERTRIEQLLFFGDSTALRRVLNADRSATLIEARLRVDETHEVAALVERLRRELAALPQPLEARIAGDAVQMAESASIVTGDQLQSIALALALIYACLALQFASWRVGLMATLPTLLQTAIYFGALGISGIPLNATTSLVECLVLGLAIDDTIHYLARFNHAARRKASEAQGAVIALRAVLRPVTLTKAILGLGFIVLVTGELRNQVLFGWLAAATLLIAWLVDLLVTPAFMSGVRVVTLWDSLRLNLGADVQKTIPLLAGLSRRQARVFALMANLQTLPAGTRLMSEGESSGDGKPGDPAGDVYVVIDGELQIWVERDGEKRVINTLGRGAVVGEIGYFGQKRIASVDTLTSARLLRFDDADQERICRQYPRIAARVFLNLNRLQAERRASQARLAG